MNILYDVFTNYNQSHIQTQTETLIKLATYYEIYKIIMNIILPILIIIGILVICYRLKKLNVQMEEKSEEIINNQDAIIKLLIEYKNNKN